MKKVMGTSPGGNATRELNLWLDDEDRSILHLWIHKKGEEDSGGWEIKVKTAELQSAIEGDLGNWSERIETPKEMPTDLASYFRDHYWDFALEEYLQFAKNADWPISGEAGKAALYESGIAAFASDQSEAERQVAFESIYNNLQSYWQVFRGAKSKWNMEKTFGVLDECRDIHRKSGLTLSNLDDSSLAQRVMPCLERLTDLKVKFKGGYPYMPVSKFLHFLNPDLFPIYDTAVVWNKVFGAFEKDYLDLCTKEKLEPWADGAERYGNYMLWAADLVRQDRDFIKCFSDWFRAQANGRTSEMGDNAGCYSGAATAFEFVAIGAALIQRRAR
jgi:hypothetical protein